MVSETWGAVMERILDYPEEIFIPWSPRAFVLNSLTETEDEFLDPFNL